MKLIDILVEETIENGWSWPERANCITQDRDREIMTATCQPSVAKFDASYNRWFLNGSRIGGFIADILANDYTTAIITREQYEAALAAKNDGWIEWGGGECPVKKGTLVDVRYRNSEEPQDAIGVPALSGNGTQYLFWRRDGFNGDIIAYRLHQPQEEKQAKADDEVDLNECIGQDAAPVWNGEGLPPVGMEVEYKFVKANYRTYFSRGKVLAYGMHNVFMEHGASKNEFIQPLDKMEFRPIRTEADRKRDEAVKAIMLTGWCQSFAEEIYDLVAAGKVPGMKLEG